MITPFCSIHNIPGYILHYRRGKTIRTTWYQNQRKNIFPAPHSFPTELHEFLVWPKKKALLGSSWSRFFRRLVVHKPQKRIWWCPLTLRVNIGRGFQRKGFLFKESLPVSIPTCETFDSYGKNRTGEQEETAKENAVGNSQQKCEPPRLADQKNGGPNV